MNTLRLLIFLFLFGLASTAVCTGSRKITVSAIGDIMAHYNLQEYVYSEEALYNVLFEETKAVFLNDDLTIANLETPVVDDHDIEGYPTFNAKNDLLDAIKASGIEMLALANNHSLDQGVLGIGATVNAVKERGLYYAGCGNNRLESMKPAIVNVNGIIIGFLSATWTTNIRQRTKSDDLPHVYIVPSYKQKYIDGFCEVIRELNKYVDLVVVGYHAGKEYVSHPIAEKEKAMKEFAEAGADVILGHHPHVLQEIEYYKTRDNRYTLIAYSLGNFISAQARYLTPLKKEEAWIYDSILSKTAESVILQFDVIKDARGISVVYPRIIPIFNICFPKYEKNKQYTCFETTFIERILAIDETQTKYKNIGQVKQLVEHRQKKITTLIDLPVSPHYGL